MKKIWSLLLLFFFIRSVGAQNLSGLTGKPDTSFTIASEYRKLIKNYPFIEIVKQKNTDSVRVEKGLVYGKAGQRKLRLDIFRPAFDTDNKKPALVFLHGGGWRSGDPTLHYALAERMATMGYVCITPEYRLSTEALFPAAVEDICQAIRWVRKNASRYGIDPERISIGGHSAGGELAALIGSDPENPIFKNGSGKKKISVKVNAVIDIDGILAFIHPESGEGDDSKKISAATYWFGYSKTEAPSLWEQASALSHAGERSAPILFLNSSIERMHAGRDDYRKILDRYGIYSEQITYENSPHSFCFFEPWFGRMVMDMDRFLRKTGR